MKKKELLKIKLFLEKTHDLFNDCVKDEIKKERAEIYGLIYFELNGEKLK